MGGDCNSCDGSDFFKHGYYFSLIALMMPRFILGHVLVWNRAMGLSVRPYLPNLGL